MIFFLNEQIYANVTRVMNLITILNVEWESAVQSGPLSTSATPLR